MCVCYASFRYGEGGAILWRLAFKLKWDYHTIYGDRAFSGAKIACDLLAKQNQYYTGTQGFLKVKPGRESGPITNEKRNLPPQMRKGVRKHQWVWWTCRENNISLVQFNDKKTLFSISTEVEGHRVKKAKRLRTEGTGANKKHKRIDVDLPGQIRDYTSGKVGVDNGDAMLRNQLAFGHLRTNRWTMKMCIYIVLLARQNAFLTHQYYHPPLKTSVKNSYKPQWDFTAALARAWLLKWTQRRDTAAAAPESSALTHARVLRPVPEGAAEKFYKNKVCVFCKEEENTMNPTRQGGVKVKVKCSKFWCAKCRVHICSTHQAWCDPATRHMTKPITHYQKYNRERATGRRGKKRQRAGSDEDQRGVAESTTCRLQV